MEFITLSSLYEVMAAFPTEESCVKYLEDSLWGGSVRSPFSPDGKVYKCKDGKYKCRDTNRYFTIKTNSIFEGSKLPLRKWMLALYLAANNKKGISSIQLSKHIGVTQRTAWFMLHRIRKAMINRMLWDYPLQGTVEMDETFVGGRFKARRRHQYKKANGEPTAPVQDKATVIGIVERAGRVRLIHVPNRQKETVIPYVYEYVKAGTRIVTDEYYRRSDFGGKYFHKSIKHSSNQFAEGDVHSNTIENVWSNLKRFVYGTHHWTSRDHLQNYLNEFMFRWNTRVNSDGVRAQQLMRQTMGCRLSYYDLTGKRPKRYEKKPSQHRDDYGGLNWGTTIVDVPDWPY